MTKDALHQLIHSLSASEKGYYIKSKGDSHLVTLFNAMNKLETYNKAALKKRLSKHQDLLKHLAKYKNNAYSDIMRAMRTYRQEKEPNIDTRLRVYLADIAFLTERGLFESAMKTIRTAKKLSTKYEKYKILLEIIHHEIDLSKRLYSKGYIEITRALIEEEKKIMSVFNDEQRYKELSHLAYLAIQQNPQPTSQKDIQYINELRNDELLTNKERAISFASQYRYHFIHALFYEILDDFPQVYKHRKEIMDSWDKYPHIKDVDVKSYTACMFNYLSVCIRLKKGAVIEQLLTKLKKEIKPKNPYEEGIMFQRVYYTELFYYYESADFEKLDTLITEIQPLLKKNAKAMTGEEIYTFKSAISYILFLMGKYEEAYKSYGEVVKQKFPIRLDFLRSAWLVRLMVAYEDEYDNFDNLYRATQRFFDKIAKEEVKEEDRLFMKFLSEVARSPSSEAKVLFADYKSRLEELEKSSKRAVRSPSTILIWMEHMITKKSMVEIYKKRIGVAQQVA